MLNLKDQNLLSALESKEMEEVEKWLALVLALDATLPPLDNAGRVDEAMAVYREGQRSVVNKIRLTRASLRAAVVT